MVGSKAGYFGTLSNLTLIVGPLLLLFDFGDGEEEVEGVVEFIGGFEELFDGELPIFSFFFLKRKEFNITTFFVCVVELILLSH